MHELRHVFVMTYGRSGSTLLMGILNSIPGWLLRGENRHAMRHLYDFHRSGLAERARVDPARASQPTHPVTSAVSADCRGTVAPPPDIDVVPAMMTPSKRDKTTRNKNG